MFDAVTEQLRKKGYRVSTFETGAEAVEYLREAIRGQSVGFGGSMTTQKLGLYEALAGENEVFWHWRVPEGRTADALRKEAERAGQYVSSVNGLAETGEIVNIDGSGNRVAATLYGHEKVWFIVGKNKLAPDLDGAVFRARNVASPKNARRLQCETPCAAKGDRCYDCSAPGRICRALVVLWDAPRGSEYEVVLVNEELGY